jgi:hypothetical protein
MANQLLEKVGEIFACLEELFDEIKRIGEIEVGKSLVEGGEEFAGGKAERLADDVGGDGPFCEAENLVEERFGVAEGAFREGGDELQGFWIDFSAQVSGDLMQLGNDELGIDAGEVKSLAAADDRWQDFMGLCGGEEKFGLLGGLFECFEEGVEGLLGEHVHFVDDVDFVFAVAWGIADGLVDLPDVVDPSIGGAVDFDHVERLACRDFGARRALVARFEIGGGRLAVERFGKEAGECRLPDAARAAEEVGVGHFAESNGIFERCDSRFLTDNISKRLRAILASEHLIFLSHEPNYTSKLEIWYTLKYARKSRSNSARVARMARLKSSGLAAHCRVCLRLLPCHFSPLSGGEARGLGAQYDSQPLYRGADRF